MTPKPLGKRNKAVTVFWLAWWAAKSAMRDETGVTAIEYALLAALIVMVALEAIALLGGGVDGLWTLISTKVAAAVGSAQ